MANIKKGIVKRSDLPPLVIEEIGQGKYFEIQTVQVTTYNGSPAILYTTFFNHNLKTGDTVEITSVTTTDYAFTNVQIIGIPAGQSNQFYIAGTTEEVFSSALELKVARIPEQYYVRYRIVSEDLNRVSHWSPIYALTGIYQQLENLGNMTIEESTSGEFIIVKWDMPQDSISTQNYDIYVAWGSTSTSVGEYNYYATISGNNIVIPVSISPITSPQAVQVSVQTSTLPTKRKVSSLTVAESGITQLIYTGPWLVI